MSDGNMTYEDWLRGCVHHDGRKGYITLPCDEILKIADYIESTRKRIEPKHGEWELMYDNVWICSHCEHTEQFAENIESTSHYCPNCGADMRGRVMEICGDNRFKIIEKAKVHLLEATNIDTSPKEMEVLDNFLFRCWQMGWLDRYDVAEQTEPRCSEFPNSSQTDCAWT